MLKTRDDMEVVHWARKIMAQHGLLDDGWQFEIKDNSSSWLGQCNYKKNRIYACTARHI